MWALCRKFEGLTPLVCGVCWGQLPGWLGSELTALLLTTGHWCWVLGAGAGRTTPGRYAFTSSGLLRRGRRHHGHCGHAAELLTTHCNHRQPATGKVGLYWGSSLHYSIEIDFKHPDTFLRSFTSIFLVLMLSLFPILTELSALTLNVTTCGI